MTGSEEIEFTIDGRLCRTTKGTTVLKAAAENDIFLPSLCYRHGKAQTGTCRICMVKSGGRVMPGCSTEVTAGLEIELDTEELRTMRLSVVEWLFAEGEHFCPACQKSGSCRLQALAAYLKMDRLHFRRHTHRREIDYDSSKIILERNRCIHCRRCIEDIQTPDGKRLFSFEGRGETLFLQYDHELLEQADDKLIDELINICPVGCILKKGTGFDTPIGRRTYDRQDIVTHDLQLFKTEEGLS